MRRFFNGLMLLAVLQMGSPISFAGDYFAPSAFDGVINISDTESPDKNKSYATVVLPASALETSCSDEQSLVSNSCRQYQLPQAGNCGLGNWLTNTMSFIGFDAYKSLGDSVIPANSSAGYMQNAGIVGGLNTGFALGSSRIRGQVGGSYGVYDLKGRDTISPTAAETQAYLTTGVYHRSDVSNGDRIAWGVVYDQLWASQWGLIAEEVYVGQFRMMTGYALNANNEVGIWSTVHTTQDIINSGANGIRIRASNQSNIYLKHRYAFGGTATGYVGAVDAADIGSWQTGLLAQAPLNGNTSLYGNSTLLFPGSAAGNIGANELLWNFSIGLSFSFGKSQNHNISGEGGLPLMNVANNGNLVITN